MPVELPPILFVDDEPEILVAVRRSLRQTPWEIETTSSGPEALHRLSEQEYSVVVSDYRMPDMDGLQLLATVRDQWPDVERLLLTAHADTAALERGINEAGISRFVRKPWDRHVLIAILEQATANASLRHERKVLLQRIKNRNDELAYLNRQLETRVEESQRTIVNFSRRWDVALNAISDPIIVVDDDLRVEATNTAAAAWTDTAPTDLEGRKCYQALFRRHAPCNACPLRSGGLAELREPDAHGAERILRARAYPMAGSRPAYLCVYQDITAESRFRQEAAQMEKMAAIGRLAGGIAHELNNPLHGILSFVQLAQKPDVESGKLHRYHALIQECAVRCRDIIQSVRGFARAPKQGEQQTIDPEEVCDGAMLLFDALQDRRLSRRGPRRHARCLGNRNQFQQVLVNLIQNALDAVAVGGQVEVGVELDPDNVVFVVEDDGPGVPEEERQRIFEPFFTTKPEGIGTGLGLAISHGIVQEHGGTLTVRPSQWGGARFEMRVPRARDPAG